MTPRRLVAVAVVVTYVVGSTAGIVLQVVGGSADDGLLDGLAFLAAVGLFVLLGAVLMVRRPGHVLGPMFAAVGLLSAIAFPGETYVASRVIAGGAVPLWAGVLAWPNTWYWYVVLAVFMVYVPVLFPDGRAPSRRWRWVLWITGASLLFVCMISAVSERIVLQTRGPSGQRLSVANPFGIAGMPSGEDNPLFDVVGMVFVICAAAAAAAVVVRFRRSTGVERQQLKWFLSAVCLLSLGMVPDLAGAVRVPVVVIVLDVLFVVGFIGLPVSITVAILRYRLYEIDRIISRTVTYAVVTGVLLAIYALVAVVPSTAFRFESDLLVAAATLASAGVFVPVRRRVQAVVDRRFNRARYDAAWVVERFGSRLRDELDLDGLTGDLHAVVAATVQPTHVRLWLRPGERL